METALNFIVQYEKWIYVVLALAGTYYLLQIPRARRQVSQTVFGLEREVARAHLARAVSMLVIVLSSLLAVFVVTTFIVPTLPLAVEHLLIEPTPVQAIAPAPDEPLQVPAEGAAPPLAEQVDNSGCLNSQATLVYPADGSQLSGAVEVRGTADIANFALYRFEVAGAATAGRWQPLAAGTSPVQNGTLGAWETSAFSPGQYAFRLVVSDAAGNSPPPCVRLVEVLPVGQIPGE